MKICVYGMWHLGSVTAACLAAAGHDVIGLDSDMKTVESLTRGKAPIMEPGLDALLAEGLARGRLRFCADAKDAVPGCKVLWVTFDTPVDEDDRADTGYVMARIREVLPLLSDDSVVLVSSQLPVGSCSALERTFAQQALGRRVGFASCPENLRLGKAIEAFSGPDRVILGVRSARDQTTLAELFARVTPRLEWMSVESAEMTKHALNAFLALSVTFANEIAALCEKVCADAKEVERGLKSEARVGPNAYLSPGAAFAGGTLARDVSFLNDIGFEAHLSTPLLGAIRESNGQHRGWPRRKLEELFGSLKGKTVAVWGLTYKPGTNTLRRSSALELCTWLLECGASVRAHDPAVYQLPDDFASISLCDSAAQAARGADALVVMTSWPEYREINVGVALHGMKVKNVVDPARILPDTVARMSGVHYVAVGKSSKAVA